MSGRLDSNQRPLEPHSSALSQAALRPDFKIPRIKNKPKDNPFIRGQLSVSNHFNHSFMKSILKRILAKLIIFVNN